MAVTQRTSVPWTRKHDLPGSPLFPFAPKIYYPASLKDLIEICKSRPPGEQLKAAGSHWALSNAAVSDSAFIDTHDPNNQFVAMDRTLYDVIPDCLHPNVLKTLKLQHPKPFDTVNLNENEGTYFIHFEAGKRIYQLYSELDSGDMAEPKSLASWLKKQGNSSYEGPWAFPTLGSAGGQTVFGALNTGTHGGDHRQAPIADAVVAIHLVADGGKHYWIEPTLLTEFESPLTKAGAVEAVYGTSEYVENADDFKVIRDTDVFNAVLVSAGRFGVVYSVVMKAVRQYCLHEERRLQDWQDVKLLINDLTSPLYTLPVANSAPAAGANKFLQIAISLVPYANFTRNLAGVTKRWNVPAVPDATNPNGRTARTGTNAGNSTSYTPNPAKPNEAQPMSFLERACSSADLLDGVLEQVAQEIKVFIEEKTISSGGVIASAGAAGGTGLSMFVSEFTTLLAELAEFLMQLKLEKWRLGEALNMVRSFFLDRRADPVGRAVRIFFWQSFYYGLFKREQKDLDYDAISYAVLDQHNYLDKSCNVNIDSIEVFFDATDPLLIAYIDALIAFEIAQEFQGKSFAGYASLRFMGESKALLGMQRWPVTCAVEVSGFKDVPGTKELIDYAISLALNNNFGGILHWGQRNPSTATQIEERFGETAPVRPGELQRWRHALNLITEGGSLNGFSSPFTRQTGLEPVEP